MDNYSIRIEVPQGKVQDILDRLTAAQEEILNCYSELASLGVLVIREDEKSSNEHTEYEKFIAAMKRSRPQQNEGME